MALKKQYMKSKPLCRVTFILPPENAGGASKASLAGDFNKWDVQATPMKRSRSGAFSTTVLLDKGKEYQFKYILDDSRWENDPQADKYSPSPVSDSQNSVVAV